MKKLTAILLILIFAIARYVYASTVSTTDGQNYTVTNDLGVSANYTGALINSYVTSTQQSMQRDQQTLVADSETYAIWSGVQQQAANADSVYLNSQTNSQSNSQANAT